MGNVSLVNGHIDGMTNYDRIRNMSVEEMAELFTAIFHEESIKMATRLKENGIDFSLVELDHDIQVAIHKQWLESEVEGK